MSLNIKMSEKFTNFPTMSVKLPTRNKFYPDLKIDEEWIVRGMSV